MQQQTDTTTTTNSSSPYYQYYQNAVVTNPPPPPPPPSYGNTPYASAPPVSVDHSNNIYSTAYPSYPQNPDHVPNPPPPAQYDAAYSPNPPPVNYDYALPPNPNPFPNLNPPQYDPSFSLNPYHQFGSSSPYSNSFESNVNYGRDGGNLFDDDGGVCYKYEPNSSNGGARGSGFSSSDHNRVVMFDDYGRPINVAGGGGNENSGFGGNSSPVKIVKAVPKVEDSDDVRSGVQKFRVKMLSEGYGQTDMDVLCQIGLDGIRLLDPSSNYTLTLYPLDSVTRWEVLDSYIFAFWARTGVDEPKRIRLKSNSYTTNNILDLVTAASIQSKEIASDRDPSDLLRGNELSAEKKKGLIDWKNFIKPANEEKDHWVPDEAKTKCTACQSDFTAFNRKHHCRNCGDIFCDKCTQGRIAITDDENAQPVRVCDACMAEVTQRMSNKEAAARASLNSHENLARKLQEEMEKNRRAGSKPATSSIRMREVACPTCTVHLQVQVPASGSETIECSVCQHPFLVSAH